MKSDLESDFELVIEWFHENFMMLNTGKCHYNCLGRNRESADLYFSDKTDANSKEETILASLGSSLVALRDYVKRSLKSFLIYPELHLIVSATLRE